MLTTKPGWVFYMENKESRRIFLKKAFLVWREVSHSVQWSLRSVSFHAPTFLPLFFPPFLSLSPVICVYVCLVYLGYIGMGVWLCGVFILMPIDALARIVL